MTAAQTMILRHMDDKRVGAFHFDPEKRWIWPQDVRSDADLAERVARWLGPVLR